MSSLSGIFPAIVTPFKADGTLDLAGLHANITAWNTLGLGGYLVLGSTGEVVHLDDSEKFAVLEMARSAIPKTKSMVVGTGLHSTHATITFTKRAADLGADYALVVTPHYFKSSMTQTVLADYYRAVADASPIKVLLYNVPQFTGIILASETIAKLAGHENIVGIKDSSGDMRAQLQTLSMVSEEFIFLTGSAPTLAPGLMMGAKGAILAVANFAGALCVEISRLINAEQHKDANKLQQQLLVLSEQIASRFGVGGIKYATACCGYLGGTVRSPLMMPDTAGMEQIHKLLQQYGLIK